MFLQACCCFFPPHNENWFPLSNEMSCLHFWAGTQLALPQRKNQTQSGTGLFYFKSQRNRSKLVDCLHIPLAMPAMFQSKGSRLKRCYRMARSYVFMPFVSLCCLDLKTKTLSYLSSPPPTRSDIHIYPFCSLRLPSAIQA